MTARSVLDVSNRIKDGRTISDVFQYLIEEVGELATEINIVSGFSKKEPGKDGIVGEAVDAIICLIDIINVYQPGITEKEILTILDQKLQKWYDSKQEYIK